MFTTTSADGTTIAYDRSGSGAPIVFVSGAFNDRHTLAPVAPSWPRPTPSSATTGAAAATAATPPPTPSTARSRTSTPS